jgi:hypothetical protein
LARDCSSQAPKVALLAGGVEPHRQLQLLGHGQGRLQGGDPQGAAVGAYPFSGQSSKVWSGAPPLSGRPSSLASKVLR